ncbi:MAG: pitrilysin family protein [Candidatus Eisenbacteria bacterium]|nr:pitrilysin family protein [Candidatus Eisenbacteria bacterium]
MRKKTFIMMLTVLAASAVFLAALALTPAAYAATRPHPSKLGFSPLKVTTPRVIDVSLSNGLTGFLVEDHEIPVVDVVLLVKTYFADEAKYGLNDMAQWVIRNGGTTTWPGDKLNDEMEYLAANIEVSGGGLNTTFSFNCLKKDLPRVMEIFGDLVTNPAFPDDKVEMRRKTMIEEIRRRNDEPNSVSRREFAQLVYRDHPYAWETTTESVNAITRDDLTNFYKTYFHPNNAIIGISGDVTKDEIVAGLEKVFANWRPADVSIPKVPDLPVAPAPSCTYTYMDINQAYISMGHQGINSNDPERCAVDVMNFILGGGSFTSWIMEKVRSDEGLAYHAASRYSSDPWVNGLFTASAQTKADACGRAITIMMDQIKRMRDVGPTADEVKKAVDSYVNSYVFDYESKSQVVRRLVQLRFEGRPLDTPQKDMEAYAKLTVADIRGAAQRYLHPDKLTLLVVGNAKLFDRPLGDFGTVNEMALEKN